jgi:excisionase family DNA binding protein
VQVVTCTADDLRALIREAVREAVGAAPATGPGWLTTTQAAQQLGVHRRTVSQWVAKGEIPRTALLQIGCHHRIAASWVRSERSA